MEILFLAMHNCGKIWKKHAEWNHRDALEYDIKLKTTMEFSPDMLHWEQDGDMDWDNEKDVPEDERASEQNFLQAFTMRNLLFSLKARTVRSA